MGTRLLALDQGTTSSRAMVVDEDGRVLGVGQHPLACHYPAPGWVEQDPEAIWATQLAAIRDALAAAGVEAAELRAIGIANQRETTVVWDRESGRAVAPAVVWQCRRSAPICEALRAAGREPLVRERTGLVLDPYFSASKLAWLLEHVPEVRRLADQGRLAFGTVDSWLLWKLSGGAVHRTDRTNAARTALLDLCTGRFDPELLALFGVPASCLPEVVDSVGPLAETDPSVLGARVLVSGVAGDQQAALAGQACTEPGMAKATYGTGAFVLLQTGPALPSSSHGLLGTLAWSLPGRRDHALEGSVFVAGAVIQWLRDDLGLLERAEDSAPLAASVPDSGGLVLVPAFTGLGAPHWDPAARGALVGISRGATRAHLARAALEAIAHQVRDVLVAMAEDLGGPPGVLRVDGGAARNDLLLQLQADLLGVPVERPVVTETTALGAACLAALGAGLLPGPEAFARFWRLERRFEPTTDEAERARAQATWQRALGRARGWAGPATTTETDDNTGGGAR
ncbi:glycerol kinase GlpK [Aciditerrimonas ferrireducens]|jgi:glycerol kinase|uniref:Glycerol kinase n=1 Tax=Aciditerrimonas ferrireducens TaxID=667306 RepID=A0ABV6BYZ1_9ACTN